MKAPIRARHARCRVAVLEVLATLPRRKVDGFSAVAALLRALPEWKASAVFEAVQRLALELRIVVVLSPLSKRPAFLRVKRGGRRG